VGILYPYNRSYCTPKIRKEVIPPWILLLLSPNPPTPPPTPTYRILLRAFRPSLSSCSQSSVKVKVKKARRGPVVQTICISLVSFIIILIFFILLISLFVWQTRTNLFFFFTPFSNRLELTLPVTVTLLRDSGFRYGNISIDSDAGPDCANTWGFRTDCHHCRIAVHRSGDNGGGFTIYGESESSNDLWFRWLVISCGIGMLTYTLYFINHQSSRRLRLNEFILTNHAKL